MYICIAVHFRFLYIFFFFCVLISCGSQWWFGLIVVGSFYRFNMNTMTITWIYGTCHCFIHSSISVSEQKKICCNTILSGLIALHTETLGAQDLLHSPHTSNQSSSKNKKKKYTIFLLNGIQTISNHIGHHLFETDSREKRVKRRKKNCRSCQSLANSCIAISCDSHSGLYIDQFGF